MMDSYDDRMFREISGVTYKSLRIPTLEDIADEQAAESVSHFPPCKLGNYVLRKGTCCITEEERIHAHIIGRTNMGKSKFLELLMRHHIDTLMQGRGVAACLVDSSDGGNTVMRVLKYAAVRGFKNIVLIDPLDFYKYNAIPCVNPINYASGSSAVASHIIDTIGILFGGVDGTVSIKKYLEATISAIHQAKGTLADLKQFVDESPAVSSILAESSEDIRNILGKADKDFKFTVTRLRPFIDPVIQLVLGSTNGMNFRELIQDGYIILVNMSANRVLGSDARRLLGTTIINEVIEATEDLTAKGEWNSRFHIYIDEAGVYDTPKIPNILRTKRKSGLRLTLAHLEYQELSPSTISALNSGAGFNVMFDSADDDRKQMLKAMRVKDQDWNLSKGEAVIRMNDRHTDQVAITYTPDANPSAEDFESYKQLIYKQPWYRTPDAIRKETNDRFESKPLPDIQSWTSRPSSTSSSPTRTEDDGATDSDSPPILRGRKPSRDVSAEIWEQIRVSKELPKDEGVVQKKQRGRKARKPDKS